MFRPYIEYHRGVVVIGGRFLTFFTCGASAGQQQEVCFVMDIKFKKFVMPNLTSCQLNMLFVTVIELCIKVIQGCHKLYTVDSAHNTHINLQTCGTFVNNIFQTSEMN